MRSRASHARAPRVGTGIRLHPWLYAAVLLVLGGAAVSGCLWLWQDLRLADDAAAPRWLAPLHGGLALAGLVVLGALLPQHVRFAWAARRNRRSGVPMLALMLALGASGYGLYYGAQSWHAAVFWVHCAVGLAAVLALPLHMVLGRRRRPVPGVSKEGV
jgi:cation transport ATPase